MIKAASWYRKRLYPLALLFPLAGFALGVWAVWTTLPPPPRGDETRHWWVVIGNAANVVLKPWIVPGSEIATPLLHTARAALPGALLWLVGISAVLRLRGPLQAHIARRRGGHLIIVGLSGLGLRILGARQARHRPALGADAAMETLIEAREAGLSVLAFDPAQPAGLARLGLDRAESLLAADEQDTRNVAVVLAAAKQAETRREPLRIVARVANPALRHRMESQLEAVRRDGRCQLRLFSTAEVAARALMLARPFDRFATAGAPGAAHLVVVGFGALGQGLLVSLLRLAHRTSGPFPTITVLDREASRRATTFAERFPDHQRIAQPRFEVVDVEGVRSLSNLWARLMATDRPPTAVYLCLSGPELCLATALALETGSRQECRHVPPILAYDPFGRVAAGLDSSPDVESSGMIETFGRLEDLFDPELVLQDDLDRLAKCSHQDYLSDCQARGEGMGTRPTLALWESLTEGIRDDNRVVADHHLVKVRDIGAVLVPDTDRADPALDSGQIERLAIAEHDRWCASRHIAGWRHGPVRDDGALLHPDLVSYHALPERQRELDRQQVRKMPALFRQVGLAVVFPNKLEICTDGSEPDWDTVSVAAAETLHRWRQPAMVLETGIGSQVERCLGEMALDAGARLHLRLTEPTYATFRRLAPDQRWLARRLLSAADRIQAGAAPPDLPENCRLRLREPDGRVLVIGTRDVPC